MLFIESKNAIWEKLVLALIQIAHPVLDHHRLAATPPITAHGSCDISLLFIFFSFIFCISSFIFNL